MSGAIGKNLLWKLMERFGVSGIQFVLQILLARLLGPDCYGVLSILLIFTSLANVFIQKGFNTSLVQNKDVEEDDYSSVLWVSMVIALIAYGIIFFFAPYISFYFNMPDIEAPIRVIALMLFPGALNSIQIAKVSREMNFKVIFYSGIGGAIISGIVSITIAFMGGGIWALVAQTLINVTAVCVIMRFTVKLKLKLKCNIHRVKQLFSYGWKILLSALLETLYQDLSSLVIGKKYDSGTLGYYNRGKQFPQYVVTAIDGAVQSVMLPAMSAEQDEKSVVKKMMRNSIIMSSYMVFPVMMGLAAVATPLISILLSEEWLPCVPYMQIFCFTFAFNPVHTCNLQAINALGRSDIYLKLEIIKKICGIAILVFAVFCFDSPLAIAMTGVVFIFIGWFINAFPNKKLIDYSYFEQMIDIVPALIISFIMFGIVLLVGTINLAPILLLIIQILVGIVTYLLLSHLIKPQAYSLLLGQMKRLLRKKVQ